MCAMLFVRRIHHKKRVHFQLVSKLIVSILFSLGLYFQLVMVTTIDGWDESTPRDTALYVSPGKDTTLHLPKRLVSKSTRLEILVIVQSATHHQEERKAIRETWGRDAKNSGGALDYVFLLGTTENQEVNGDIQSEMEEFDDIVQENFVDSYNNLTIKSVMMLKFLMTHPIQTEFVFKMDDDCYLNVAQLFSSRALWARHAITGYAYPPTPPIRYAPFFMIDHKWVCPTWMFSGDLWPEYLSGMGYIMPQSMMQCLYEASLVTPLIHLEDVYLTGLLAGKCNFKVSNHPGFVKNPSDPCKVQRNDSLIHYMDFRSKWIVHDVLKNGYSTSC